MSQTFASWNQVVTFMQRIDGLRRSRLTPLESIRRYHIWYSWAHGLGGRDPERDRRPGHEIELALQRAKELEK